jgi:ATP-dependent Clp protease ATP-binding subunit ClpA
MANQMARLSELSRRVISAAEQLAVHFEHPSVGIGHLLLALAQETRSPTASYLRDCGLDTSRMYAALLQADGYLLLSVEHILTHVHDQVADRGSHYTGTQHLLLAVLADPAGSTVLEVYGVQLDALRRILHESQ